MQLVGDVNALPFADASFGLAVAACCLNHLPDPEAALVEVRRVASAVVASAFRAGWTHPAKTAVDAIARDLGYVAPSWYLHFKADVEPRTATPAAMRRSRETRGLARGGREHVPVSTGVSDPRQLVRWRLGMAHLAPWVASLPEDVRADLVRRCEDAAHRSTRSSWSRSSSSPRASRHRCTRAPEPRIRASTSASVAIDVSPGVVIASAPCAAPYSTASAEVAGQQPVDQTGREAVAATNPVENLQSWSVH